MDNALNGGGTEWDVVRITVHEADVLPIRNNLNNIAGQKRSPPSASATPVQDGSTLEMATAADQSQPVAQGVRLAIPVDDGWIGTHDPLPVGGMEVNRRISESAAPLDHARIVVRMGDGEGRKAAHCLDCLNQCLIEQRDAIPEDVARCRADKQGSLTDGEMRFDADADKSWFLKPK